jgi:hypothetical protein
MSYKPFAADTLVLPVISAAVAAYLDREQSESAAFINRRQPAVACGSVWSLRGRELLMERRQLINIRRDKRK